MAEQVGTVARSLYMYNRLSAERPIALLCTYLETRREQFLAALNAA
jgi:hypothetical protein